MCQAHYDRDTEKFFSMNMPWLCFIYYEYLLHLNIGVPMGLPSLIGIKLLQCWYFSSVGFPKNQILWQGFKHKWVIWEVILESIVKGIEMWNREEKKANKGVHLSRLLNPWWILGNSLQNHPFWGTSKLGCVSSNLHLSLTDGCSEVSLWGLLPVEVLLV